MQMVGFPPDTRTALAALELQHETGQLTDAEYATQETATIEAARTLLHLDATWQLPPSPPVEHNPMGRTSVFWKE